MRSIRPEVHPDAEVADAIARYRPRKFPERAARCAREVVTTCCPSSPARARTLLWAATRLAAFGISIGLEPVPGAVFHPSVIERFILIGTGDLSPAGVRTVRTNLRFLVATLARAGSPLPVGLPRERAKAPYTDADMAAYLALADAQPTESRRMRAIGLICLGAGAGLMGADLRHVRGTDVVLRSGGLLVDVSGRHRRVVPVRVPFRRALLASAGFAGSRYVVGGNDPDRHNVTTPLLSSLSGGVDLPRLSTSRLRATWLAAVAETIGLRAFMDAAGIVCSQRLGDLVATLAPVDEETAVAVVGGRG
jgi:integrase